MVAKLKVELKERAKMSYAYEEEDDEQYSAYPAQAMGPMVTTFQQVTTKIPPGYNGTTSWFAYEEAIDDWTDVTELDAQKQGPALKNRLDGEAAVYKPLLDRDLLRGPDGVAYFKATLRPHFVKGNQAVWLWRFFQVFKSARGNQDFLRWIARFQVLRKRLGDAWMDLFTPALAVDANFQMVFQARFLALQAQNQVLDEDEALDEYNRDRRNRHQAAFPINDNLMALIFVVLADLTETQRERLASTLALRGVEVQQYTFEGVRTVFIELFCAPRSSLDNPSLRAGGAANRVFCIMESGEMDQVYGYWCEDDSTGEVGFLPEIEDVFWVFDDMNECWLARRFTGRSLRRGTPKGKGKGKGHKGFKKFKPYKPFNGKGGSKGGQAHAVDSANATSSKGKEKKGKGKGKGKAKGKDGAGDQNSGKGKGFTADSATAEPAPSAEAAQTSDTSWQTTWWEQADWSEAGYGNFFAEELQGSTALAVNSYEAYSMGCFEAINMDQNPTFVILDLGCTKCMGSRKKVERFLQASASYGFSHEWIRSGAKFSFANSEQDTIEWKVRVWFPTSPPVFTDIEVLEKGNCPILLSLQQMQNLRFSLELTPDVVYLTCRAFNFHRTPLSRSTSKHLVLNLAEIQYHPGGTPSNYDSFMIKKDTGLTAFAVKDSDDQPQQGAKKEEENKQVQPKAEPTSGERAKEEEQEAGGGSSGSTESPAPGVPEPQDPGAAAALPSIPLARRRILAKLSSDVELLKLHLKHQHMSLEQFKKRTSALDIPQYIYDKYAEIVRKCQACMEHKPPPPRSKVSGLRATAFGELVFVDHCFVTLMSKEYTVFLILDGATMLLYAQCVPSKDDEDAMRCIRTWMDNYQCRPKSIVGDMAFMGDRWQAFYSHYGIKPVPLGPRTPWPNRAETAVRLFKRQLVILANSALADPTLKRIKGMSAQELVKNSVWARNTQLTYSGKSPIELAFGRRPPDLIMIENSDPAQLTGNMSTEDLKQEVLQRLAIKAHIEAQQLQDLRKDIASRLRPSEGPFSPGEKIFYWDQDHSKIKSGKWIRARVVGQTGSMVAIDTGKQVLRVNESKIRKDKDEWHDIELPEEKQDQDEQPLQSLAPAPPTPTVVRRKPLKSIPENEPLSTASSSTGRTSALAEDSSFEAVMWQAVQQGKINFLELFAGSARLSAACSNEGLQVGSPIDLRTGFDLNTKQGQRKAWQIIMEQQPDIVFMAPVCTPWSALRNTAPIEVREAERAAMLPMVKFCTQVALHQMSKGKHFLLENPETSAMWKQGDMLALAAKDGVTWGTLDFCCYGMRDPGNQLLMKKAVSLLHSFPPETLAPLFRRCSNHDPKTHVHHMHQKVEGWCKGYGRRSAYSQVYPRAFCHKLAMLLSEFLAGGKFPALFQSDLELLTDILETDADDKISLTAFKTYLDQHEHVEPLPGLDQRANSFAMVSTALAVPVKDHQVMELISWANSLPKHSEVVVQGEDDTVSKRVFKLLKHLRQHYLPLQNFMGCSVLRGTLGSRAPTNEQDEDSYCVMWKKREPRQVYVTQVSTVHESSFDPTIWTIVLFWGQSRYSRPDQPGPAPRRASDEDQDMDDLMHDPARLSEQSDQPMDDQMNDPDPDNDPNLPPPGPTQPPTQPPDQDMFPPDNYPGNPPDPPQMRIRRPRSRSPPRVPSTPGVAPQPPPDPPSLPPGLPDDIITPEPDQPMLPPTVPIKPDTPELRPTVPKHPRSMSGDDNSSSKSSPHKKTKQDTKQDEDTTPHVPSGPSASSSSSSVQPLHQFVNIPTGQSSASPQDQPGTPSQNTGSDTDDEFSDVNCVSAQCAPDVVLFTDAKDWRKYGEISRVLTQTASFSFPQGADGPLNADEAELHEPHANFFVSKFSRVETADLAKLTSEDKGTQLLSALAAKKVVKGRKEATATDLRQYSKQFLEAKLKEYQSWKDNEVFELVDTRKIKVKNFITGRWVLTIKRHPDGTFDKCKARWVLRGFLDRQKEELQTDSPTATRPGFRLTCQLAANRGWDVSHIDLKTAFLQGESYDELRNVVCQLPPEAGLPTWMAARLVKPAYGLNDAPRKWWNVIDKALTSYGMIPTRADRCCYVLYKDAPTNALSKAGIIKSGGNRVSGKTPESSADTQNMLTIDKAINFLMDPVSGSNSQGKTVCGVVCLHVDDLFITGNEDMNKKVLSRLRQDFQVGSEDKNEIVFTGQRVRKLEGKIVVDQDAAVEELKEVEFDKTLKDDVACDPRLHTAFRSGIGSLNWLQSRTQYHIAYKFSRLASASASPTIGDLRALNKLIRSTKVEPVKLIFHKLQGPCRIVGFPDASYRNNSDKSSQRGQVIFLAEPRASHNNLQGRSQSESTVAPRWRSKQTPDSKDLTATKGSMVDYESHKINRTTLSTTVSELYSLMKCFGTCLFLKGLWRDLSGETALLHLRSDANNLVTTARTTHLPEQRETVHLISMLRKEACSGSIDDLAHVRSEDCLADCLTKSSAKPDSLIKAVETGNMPGTDAHPPFRDLIQHKAYLIHWLAHHVDHAHALVTFLAADYQSEIQSYYAMS